MKKLFALALALTLLFCSASALAEAPANAAVEGEWVQFEDGFQLYVPTDWVEVEVTDEMIESGVFYVLTSPDQSQIMQLGWYETAMTTLDELLASAQVTYAEAQILEINGIGFVTYDDATNDATSLFALDAAGAGMYSFTFQPASDDTLAPIALTIAGSISNFEVE